LIALNQQERHDPEYTSFSALYVEAMPAGLEIRPFTHLRALFGRYDLIHLHWPEFLVRGPGIRGWIKRAMTLLLLLRIQLLGTVVIRTLHNLAPHEPGSAWERWICGRLDRRARLVIVLNPAEPVATPPAQELIPHPDYQRAFDRFEPADRVLGLITFVGIIRPYKGVDSLLHAFVGLDRPDLQLRLMGAPLDADISERVKQASRDDSRISHRLERTSDAVLVDEMTRAQLVVLPYRHFYNSGVALAALSVGRPILVPRTRATDWLAMEVGEEWVIRHDGELTAADLQAALERTVVLPETLPRFIDRDPARVAELHARAYLRAIQPGRRRLRQELSA
jgi:beta-1,4-mannosyltransferase